MLNNLYLGNFKLKYDFIGNIAKTEWNSLANNINLIKKRQQFKYEVSKYYNYQRDYYIFYAKTNL